MAVTGGNTRDDRSVMIDVVCHDYHGDLAAHIREQLRRMPVWFPWVVVFIAQGQRCLFSGSWGFLRKPSSNTIESRKRGLASQGVTRVRPVLLDMERLLRAHVEISADEDAGEEGEWPMKDKGPASWLDGPTYYLEKKWTC